MLEEEREKLNEDAEKMLTDLGDKENQKLTGGKVYFHYTPAKRIFSGVHWNQPVCLSICPSVFKIILILCLKLLQFCFSCIEANFEHTLIIY